MKVLTWDSIFGPITGKQNKKRSLQNAQWTTLMEDVIFDGIPYAKGSFYKFWEGKDFGFVYFRRDSKSPDGSIPGKFLHKY